MDYSRYLTRFWFFPFSLMPTTHPETHYHTSAIMSSPYVKIIKWLPTVECPISIFITLFGVGYHIEWSHLVPLSKDYPKGSKLSPMPYSMCMNYL